MYYWNTNWVNDSYTPKIASCPQALYYTTTFTLENAPVGGYLGKKVIANFDGNDYSATLSFQVLSIPKVTFQKYGGFE